MSVRTETPPLHNEAGFGAEGAPPGKPEQIMLGIFVVLPILAILAAVPVAWGGWLGPLDLVLLAVFYVISTLGVTVGMHRLFTHKAFKPNRGVKIALGVAASLAIQGPITRWVADHRKHHKFSDREGDPHSPWRYGETVPALTKGLAYAHLGWMFNAEQTPQRQYAPDLLKDRDIVRLSKLFPMWVLISLALPPVIGGLATWSWQGAATAFFWGSLVRLFLVHHVTWSINSICHTVGESPFKSRDHSGNVWWLAIPSMGESWHNLHHADPTCARHGVLPGQIDISARVIWLLEKAGWVRDVRWPVPSRIEAKRVEATARAAA
ncbi:acyl-CoA desaturase [Mumia sp. zg.B53]|uniref:acyl-CoA desaturase n=1 Tax=unclassified Mumia TaxID=2621872 RepID=UPI001C6F33F2|nr:MULTISPECIES: acyl-CoA desaturase [unclassified Mumia]MBW9206920.1 acyl-CoA desaturase [Mumia sp. zg.B17]MBW9210746.1 acyl-CoA desaturase [Mumia sp. zg.B21]MBW9215359.1 acyl-CoA desaturase [Mumia sp. zg.B53]MDD9350544.1 acyl-CoA desaturase [Mumia sp.]